MHRDPPLYIHGQNLSNIYHRGDVTKLEILLEYGGIYLDYDVIVVNSLDPVRRYDATLGKTLTYLHNLSGWFILKLTRWAGQSPT